MADLHLSPKWWDAMKLATKHPAFVSDFGGFEKGRGKELFEALKEHAEICEGCMSTAMPSVPKPEDEQNG